MLGGGVFVTQNKVLPGAYINFVNASAATATLGERGIVAIPYAVNKSPGTIIEITNSEFIKDCNNILGFEYGSFEAKPFREIFAHATKCVIYDLGVTDEDAGTTAHTASEAIAALEPYNFNIFAIYTSTSADISAYIAAVKTWRDAGKKCQAVVYNATTPDDEGIINVVSTVSDYESQSFTGDGTKVAFVVTEKPNAIDAVYVDGTLKTVTTDYTYDNSTGTVTFGSAPDNEAVIEVRYYTSPAYALVAWVSGAEAGCAINSSCTNQLYDGEHTVVADKTQAQLETCITSGQLTFHNVYGDIRLLEDINSLVTTTIDKGEDFKSNQTIRIIDQIANDIAKLFNTKYLGRIPNDASGRVSLWGDIVSHHRQLETIRAIEDFDANLVTVEQGNTKKSVVVNDVITPVNAMAQLYMTVVVQ